jgi:hypothetical protein
VVRIFASLSCFTVLLLLTNLAIGLYGGDYNGVSSELRAAQAKLNSVSKANSIDTGESSLESRDDVLARLGSIQKYVRIHMLFGIMATLVAVLVQSIGVTYFIGTGRWGKEVCDTYQLPDELTRRGTQLKRKAFPWALLGMGTVLLIACFGAAADPGTLRETTANWVQPHFWAAMLGTMFIAFALWRQWGYIGDNQRLIEEVVAAVHEIRVKRGLPVDDSSASRSSAPAV